MLTNTFINNKFNEREIGSKKHLIINIGTGSSLCVKNVVLKIKEILNSKSQIEWNIPHRENEIWFLCANIARAKSILNWQAKSFSDRIESVINWYLDKNRSI